MTTDGTQTQKGTSAQKQDSSVKGAEGTSGEQAPKTYSEADVQKLVSDRLAAAGREAKSLEEREQKIAQWQARRDEEEQEAARGDPAKLTHYQKDKALRDREAVVAKREREVEQKLLVDQVEIEEAKATRMEIDIFEIAQEYEGGDAVKLKKLSDTFKATSKEQIREAAENLWEKKGKQTTTSKVRHDSGMTIGGVNSDDLTPREKIEKGLEKARGK